MREELKKEMEEQLDMLLDMAETGEGGEEADGASYGKKEYDDYNDFVSDCMKQKGGGSDAMSECAKEWKERKETISQSEKDRPEGETQNEEETGLKDVLVVTDGCPPCKKLQSILADDILSERVKLVDAKSGMGQNIIAQMPEDEPISLPFYAEEKKLGYEHHDLEELLKKYAD